MFNTIQGVRDGMQLQPQHLIVWLAAVAVSSRCRQGMRRGSTLREDYAAVIGLGFNRPLSLSAPSL